jgi:hypothetical protein
MNLTGFDIAVAAGEIDGDLVEAADAYPKPRRKTVRRIAVAAAAAAAVIAAAILIPALFRDDRYSLYYVKPATMGDYPIDLSGWSDISKYSDKLRRREQEARINDEGIPEGKKMTVDLLGEKIEVTSYTYNSYYDQYYVKYVDRYSGTVYPGAFRISAKTGAVEEFYRNIKMFPEMAAGMNCDIITPEEASETAKRVIEEILGEKGKRLAAGEPVLDYFPDERDVKGWGQVYTVFFHNETVDGWQLTGSGHVRVGGKGDVIGFYVTALPLRVEPDELPPDFSDEKIMGIIKSCMKDPDAEYVIEQKSVIKSLGRLCARCYFVPVTDGVRGNGYSLYIPLD